MAEGTTYPFALAIFVRTPTIRTEEREFVQIRALNIFNIVINRRTFATFRIAALV